MEDRLFDLINKLNHLEDDTPSIIELRTMISEKNMIGQSPKYSNTELAILFNYYKQFITEINKYTKYLPTKQNFCSFAGISTRLFDSYKQSEDAERRDIIQQIEDYITDIMLTSAQNGEIREITTIFRAKAEHGLVEQTAPIVIEHKTEANVDEIMKQIQAVNQGRSLREIELKKDKNNVYIQEENE